MKCPIDQTDLVMTDRQGVEIDYCPTCRGVWLDRGELDKIIDRAAPAPTSAEGSAGGFAGKEWDTPAVGGMSGKARPLGSRETYDDDRDEYPDRYDNDNRRPVGRKKKRGSFLEDLFDFD
jgi:Zn-finger nucleic acid-binding protein